jgi:hypothetical protein
MRGRCPPLVVELQGGKACVGIARAPDGTRAGAAAAPAGIGDLIVRGIEKGAEAPGTPVPRLICVLSIGRTGSNHLCDILTCIPEIDSRAELFNPKRSCHMHRHELAELARRAGKCFEPSDACAEALETMRRRPRLVLDCLSSLMPPEKRVLSFKVLMGQLTSRQIERKIIGRPDTVIAFLCRRPVDAFISHRKAMHLQQWRDTDTTDVKIEIDAQYFVKWWRKRAAWHIRMEAECWYRRKPFHHLTYEDDVAGPPAEAARRFCAILARHGLADLAFPDDSRISGAERQDRTPSVAERVSNWREFQRGLEAMGCLDQAFAPFPHFRPNAVDRLRRWLFGPRRRDRRSFSARIRRSLPYQIPPVITSGA